MSGTLPEWFERLLGIHAEPGEGTVWSLEHTWAWPPWVTVLFLAFAVVFVVAIYLREGRRAGRPYRLMLAALRLAVVVIVLLMIAQVSLSLKRSGLPYLAVIVDDSLSMTIVDRYEEKVRTAMAEQLRQAQVEGGEPSRWNLARTLLCRRGGAMLSELSENYKLRVYFLTGIRPSGETAVPELCEEIAALRPTGESTRLGAAVRAVLDELRGTVPAAIVLLSDGINTDGPPLAEAAAPAQRRNVPLFLVGLGSDQPVRDLKLSDLLVDDVVFVDDVVNFDVQLTGSGLQGTKVCVVLREKDQPQVLAQVEATVGPDGQSQQVRLSYRPSRVGRFQYVVEVDPQPGELQTANNRLEKTIEVRKEKIRVLLVQAYPSYEFRYLRNMLARDETIELHTVLQEADVQYAEQDPAALRVFPVRREELFAYDVIILGDVNPALLSAATLQNVADFVDQPGKGGALICIAGPKYMPAAYRDSPLARLIPVDLGSIRLPDANQALTEGFVVQPTELGLTSPPLQLGDTPAETRTIWQHLPPVYWLLEAPDLKPAARVLAEHPTRLGHDGRRLPVICMQYVGAGKVLLHATDETWRWRWRMGDALFARYWIQMIRYLARSKLSEGGRSAVLSTDQAEYQRGESVRLRLRFADPRQAPAEDDGVTVVVEHPGNQTQRLPLRRTAAGQGIFEGLLSKPPVGSYHAWVAIPAMEGRSPTADFTVKPPAGEFERVQMDAAALKQAAQLTKGRFYTFQTAPRLVDDLPPGHQVPIESPRPEPLWNKWPVVLIFLVLLIGEWILRKRGGML
jgi:hypothetical protein